MRILEERCLRTEASIAALERIAADEVARRELLWLRAMEKEDEESRLDLERIDPALRARMKPVLDAFAAEGPMSFRERREWFGRAWDACYALHAGDLDVACACSQCLPPYEELQA